MKRLILQILPVLICLLIGGCASPASRNVGDDAPLRNGEVLQIVLTKGPTDMEFQKVIDAEGEISLPYSKARVAGKTLRQARATIERAYNSASPWPPRVTASVSRLP